MARGARAALLLPVSAILWAYCTVRNGGVSPAAHTADRKRTFYVPLGGRKTEADCAQMLRVIAEQNPDVLLGFSSENKTRCDARADQSRG